MDKVSSGDSPSLLLRKGRYLSILGAAIEVLAQREEVVEEAAEGNASN
jgi:hypothetical protein